MRGEEIELVLGEIGLKIDGEVLQAGVVDVDFAVDREFEDRLTINVCGQLVAAGIVGIDIERHVNLIQVHAAECRGGGGRK